MKSCKTGSLVIIAMLVLLGLATSGMADDFDKMLKQLDRLENNLTKAKQETAGNKLEQKIAQLKK